MKLKFAIFQIYTIEQFFQEVLAPSEACIVNISVLRPVDETLSLWESKLKPLCSIAQQFPRKK